MKIEVIEKRANQVRNVKCPVCKTESPIVIREGQTEGSLNCWFCSSLLGWSIEDEVKPVEEEKRFKYDIPELTPEERKKVDEKKIGIVKKAKRKKVKLEEPDANIVETT